MLSTCHMDHQHSFRFGQMSVVALVLQFTTRASPICPLHTWDGLLQVSQPSQITDLLHWRNEWNSWKRRRPLWQLLMVIHEALRTIHSFILTFTLFFPLYLFVTISLYLYHHSKWILACIMHSYYKQLCLIHKTLAKLS